MATLEYVMQMKQQGISEHQIIQELQQQGISPNEINEALSQSNIKNELISNQINFPYPSAIQQPEISEQIPQQTIPPQSMQRMQGMQPSMMTTEQIPFAQPPINSSLYSTMQIAPEPYSTQTYQSPYYDEYQPQQSSDIETINDIAEQIVEEKTMALKNQITEATRFKDELILEIEKINQRLTKIEDVFNQLQMAILGKIGEYGEDIKNISKEMQATQESFSKMINPVIDKARKTRPSPKTKK